MRDRPGTVKVEHMLVTPPQSETIPTAPTHALSDAQHLVLLQSDAQMGLDAVAVEKSRHRWGWNELASAPSEPVWKKLLAQFNDVVVWILLAAALISGLTGEWTDTAAVIAIVLLNAILGFFQEERAERALAALQDLAAPLAKVVRGGQLQTIAARELVPGDIVELEAGDNVPADVRLLTTFSLRIQEAALTGESVPVDKDAAVILPVATPLGDRRNLAYMSTIVANGTARGLVTGIGMATEIGRIAGMLQRSDREPTPLQRQLAKLGRTLVFISLSLVIVILGLSLWRGDKLLDALLAAVSLAVAAVPEGLPAVVTVTLALGLQRMVKRNALIRKLPSVETLGCVTVICSDKTGTLTRNEMTVREIWAGGRLFRVTGAGYAPHGEFYAVNSLHPELTEPAEAIHAWEDPDLRLALRIGAVCNHARVEPGEEAGNWRIIGDPTEGALVVVAQKADIVHDVLAFRIKEEVPFDSERKLMSVTSEDAESALMQYTKGAPEGLIDRCGWEFRDGRVALLTDDRRSQLIDVCEGMARRALRVLACGYRRPDTLSHDIVEDGLTFVGFFGMIDPPREEVKAAVARCREAGIRTVMITGDHPATAEAIGSELGIVTADASIISGHDIDRLDDEALRRQAEHTAVYARVTPEHKLRVVRALQSLGHVVAMTGDGVNDAPAVKAADIGIAMGLTGTHVTREAAAMVLMDDNFTSIVNAVEEGRAIYDNIQKFLIFLLSCNVGELLLMLVAGMVGWPAPLLPIQLLWINLVTDGLPALALAMEPPEPDLMRRRPRLSNEAMLSWSLGGMVLGQGLLLALVGLAAFNYGLSFEGNIDRARTLAFSVVVYGELFRALAARSRIWTFWQLRPETNPYLFAAVTISVLLQISILTMPFAQPIFQVTSHTFMEWLILITLALTPVTLIELFKLARQRTRRTMTAKRLSSFGDRL